MGKTLIRLSIAITFLIPGVSKAFVGGENWDYEAAEKGVSPSYTLPVLHIDTDNGTVIDQKEEYIDAVYWLETGHLDGVDAVGSADSPLALGIRGRGNSTWTQCDKKPYKLKLDKKQSLLGMPKSKHYALLHFVGGFSAYFAHPLGMEIGRHIMKTWTPRMAPVEVVLNGQYIGLYVLAETVRIDDGRVEIFEQPEDNRDPETITGGYLVEIDNYLDENQLQLWENDVDQIYVTVDTPDPMNTIHKGFITYQFDSMTAALYEPDKLSRDWENLIDADSYARHFVVEEIMNNQDAYNGSCKMYKDLGERWTFGPLWDVGDSFDTIKEDFTFNTTPYRKTWIPQTYRFPRFVKLVQQVWREFREIDPAVWHGFLADWNSAIERAEDQNQTVWKYFRGTSAEVRMRYTAEMLDQHIEWLDGVWGGAPLTRNVSITVEGDGTASLGGHGFPDVDVFAGDDLLVELAPDAGRVLSYLRVNGEDALQQADNGRLALANITDDIRIDAGFATPSSTDGISAETAVWQLIGSEITASTPVAVYDVAGALIGRGTAVALPAKGVYIIKAGTRTYKTVY